MSFLGFFQRNLKVFNPPTTLHASDSKAIKFGILDAAAFAQSTLIFSARSHAEVVIYAIAARSQDQATACATKHGIEKVYGGSDSYQELLDDPEVDAVYNALPNGLHSEWTMKALLAGKHVLSENPVSNTAEETSRMFELAASRGLTLLEVSQCYRFHPTIQRARAILASGELGAIKRLSTELAVPDVDGINVRFDYSLNGGNMMHLDYYTLSTMRYLASADPTAVISATAFPPIPPSTPGPSSFNDPSPKVARGTTATLAFPNEIVGALTCKFGVPHDWGVIFRLPQARVECEAGDITIYNIVTPYIYHSITVRKRTSGNTTEKRVEKVYKFDEGMMEGKGEVWWSSYRYQLEAFVDKVKGRSPQTWVDKEDSVANMEWIEKIYNATGLGVRPKSEYALSH